MLIIYIPVRNLRVRTKFEKKELRTIFLSDFRFQTRLNNLWSCVTLIFIIWWIYSHCVFKSFGSITVKTCMSVMYSDTYVVYPKKVQKIAQWFGRKMMKPLHFFPMSIKMATLLEMKMAIVQLWTWTSKIRILVIHTGLHH